MIYDLEELKQPETYGHSLFKQLFRSTPERKGFVKIGIPLEDLDNSEEEL